jgi:hypothetical protein
MMGCHLQLKAWLLRDKWFGAYDAALWLVAFATLETICWVKSGMVAPQHD